MVRLDRGNGGFGDDNGGIGDDNGDDNEPQMEKCRSVVICPQADDLTPAQIVGHILQSCRLSIDHDLFW